MKITLPARSGISLASLKLFPPNGQTIVSYRMDGRCLKNSRQNGEQLIEITVSRCLERCSSPVVEVALISP
jgi:hypothetical protein